MVATRKAKIKCGMAVTRRVNKQFRPPNFHDHMNLIHETPAMCPLKKGLPDFNIGEDVIKSRSRSYRSYKKAPPQIDRRVYFEDLKERMKGENAPFHELHGKFHFLLQGSFHQKGEIFEEELFNAAFNMHLVGWMKVRSNFAKGHFQGDLLAISAMQRWIMQKHLSRKAGEIHSHEFSSENWGLAPIYPGTKYNGMYPIPHLRYRTLVCVKDWRKSNTRKMHRMLVNARGNVRKMEAESALLRAKQEVEQLYMLDGVKR